MSTTHPPPTPTPTAMLIATAILSLAAGYMLGIASSLGFLPVPFSFTSRPSIQGPRTRSANYDDEEESAEEEVDIDELGGGGGRDVGGMGGGGMGMGRGVGVGVLDHAPNWGNGIEADKRDGLRVRRKTTTTGEVGQGDEKKSAGRMGGSRPEWEGSDEECKLVLVVRTDLGMSKGKIAAQASHATLACYKSLLQQQQTNPFSTSPLLRRWERQGQAKVALQVKSEEELTVLQAKARSLGLVAEVITDAGRTQISAGSRTVLGVGPGPKSVVDRVTGGLKLL